MPTNNKRLVPIAEAFEIRHYGLALRKGQWRLIRCASSSVTARQTNTFSRHTLLNQTLIRVFERIRAVGMPANNDRLVPVAEAFEIALDDCAISESG